MNVAGKIFINTKLFLVAVFILCSTLANASSDTLRTQTIAEITVSESALRRQSLSSVPTQTLNAENLRRLNSLQLSDAIKFLSGVNVRDYGGIGGLKTVSVRSLGAEHTTISLDGVPVSDIMSGQIDLSKFSLDGVEQIALVNGQSDNIFQTASNFAASSVLFVNTGFPLIEEMKSFSGKVSLRAGSFGLLNPTFFVRTKILPHTALALSGEYLYANGEYPFLLHYGNESDSVSHEMRHNSDVNNLRLQANIYSVFSAKSKATLKTYLYNSQRGLPGAAILYNTQNAAAQRLNETTVFIQGNFTHNFSKVFDFQVNAKFNYGYLHYLDTAYLNAVGKMESRYRQYEYYASATALYRFSERLSASFSSDFSTNTLSAVYESQALSDEFPNPVRYKLLSVLAAKYIDETWLATVSLLHTAVSDKTSKGSAAGSQNRLSPSASVSFKPFDENNFHIRAFYKNIFRLPTFNDLYYARVGNPALQPEKTSQINVGITELLTFGKRNSELFFAADVYYNKVKDKIVAMPVKNLFMWTMLNLGKVDIAGIDLASKINAPVTSKVNLSFSANYTYQRALDVSDKNSDTYLHQIPYTPRISGSLTAAIQNPIVDVAYTLVWSGKRYAAYQNYAENRLPAYADQSISFSHNFRFANNNLIINAELLNIFNNNYEIVRWFPMPGRQVRVKLELII
ncbi:MAG: TonB-dependent receptor plug domain-containing protein [Paludibacter sp.]|jgi:hypothetical protein|nr:TonB-dependent receptor plug domain-containing protein [Paludibacter sp.]